MKDDFKTLSNVVQIGESRIQAHLGELVRVFKLSDPLDIFGLNSYKKLSNTGLSV